MVILAKFTRSGLAGKITAVLIPTLSWRTDERKGEMKLAQVWFFVLALTAGVGLLIGSGVIDPKPVGVPVMTLTDLIIQKNSYSDVLPLLFYPNKNNFSIILTARNKGFALLLHEKIGKSHLSIEIRPEGFATLAGTEGEPKAMTTAFPHILPERNELWLDVKEDTLVAIKINRELFWEGEIYLQEPIVRIAGLDAQKLYLEKVILFE